MPTRLCTQQILPRKAPPSKATAVIHALGLQRTIYGQCYLDPPLQRGSTPSHLPPAHAPLSRTPRPRFEPQLPRTNHFSSPVLKTTGVSLPRNANPQRRPHLPPYPPFAGATTGAHLATREPDLHRHPALRRREPRRLRAQAAATGTRASSGLRPPPPGCAPAAGSGCRRRDATAGAWICLGAGPLVARR